MLPPRRPSRALACAIALGACSLGLIHDARAQTTQGRVDTTTVISFKPTLAGHSTQWYNTHAAASLELGIGPGGTSVIVKSIHFVAPALSCVVPMGGNVNMTVNGLIVDTLAAAPITIPAQLESGKLVFAAEGLPSSAVGTVNYSATGLPCIQLRNQGGACAGPCSLALAGANTSGRILSGEVAATPGANGRTFAINYFGSFPLAVGASWGMIDISANLRGTFPEAGVTICAPDFDGIGGLNIQDIFAFLNAWLAGDPRADFNHFGGLEVLDIFDFLNAWFAGC